MANDAVAHALRIDTYIERYGLEVVEHVMDIGFAPDRHIDPHRGLERQPYPPRHVVEKERPVLPYDDLMHPPPRSITYTVEAERLPPHPERDLLWFLITYAPLEDWQRDVLQILREESYYFYPQFNTKILNEGWAKEFGESRIWAGSHFRSDVEAGYAIGRAVAQKVIERATQYVGEQGKENR
jgi:stage V sporulation protein R